jgi:type III pantothenate kinase
VKLADRCLQLDVGNSGAKWRLLRSGSVAARGNCIHGSTAGRDELLACTDNLEQIWIASVASPQLEAELIELLAARWDVTPWLPRSAARSGELRNSYRDPARMGVDRWLAMLAARHSCEDRFCVVDAGSALTIDLVGADGQHEGGYIIPGVSLMERALLLDTGQVRFDEAVDYQLAPGRSTAEAVRHGIALAQAGALTLALEQAGPGLTRMFYCGGGGEQLMALAGRGGDFCPDLVFEGLTLMADLLP